MSATPDWNKHSAISGYLNALIALIVGVAAIVVTVLLWSHPYNPNSPPFIGIPAAFWGWLSAWGPTLLSGACLALSFMVYGKAKRVARQISTKPTALQEPNSPAPPSVPATLGPPSLPIFNPALTSLMFSYPEGFAFEIKEQPGGTRGYTLAVINNMPEFIGSYLVEVAEVNSWSQIHKKFLPRNSFKRKPVSSGSNFPPMERVNARWLIKVILKQDVWRLSLYDDDSAPLLWPNNDDNTVEIWRITLASAYKMKASDKNWKPLPPTYVVVKWNREDSTLEIAKWEPAVIAPSI